MKITKRSDFSEAVNPRMTDNTMAKEKGQNGKQRSTKHYTETTYRATLKLSEIGHKNTCRYYRRLHLPSCCILMTTIRGDVLNTMEKSFEAECTILLYNISVPLDLKVTCDTRLILNIIYVWKLNQTVLELDLWAVKFLFEKGFDYFWQICSPQFPTGK
jgi:hypothetical protein